MEQRPLSSLTFNRQPRANSQTGGLFPRPSDIRFSCSCLDHAAMCKHVAAVLYSVGAASITRRTYCSSAGGG